ncbi:MAG: GNAT family N-acetyltransferase [Negativicutes bacterium]|jgi:GNAT superfamily N-acetyltransferase
MFDIRFATIEDVPTILKFIRALAEYEHSLDQVSVDERLLRDNLFGTRKCAEVVIAFYDGAPAGFALFFHNFSTFLGKPGLYLEDLYVLPEMRGRGCGKKLLSRMAQLAVERGCGRLEWGVIDWNQTAIDFYKSIQARVLDEWTIYRVSGADLQTLASGNRLG